MARTADRDANYALKARFAEVQRQYERIRDGLAEMQQQMAQMQVTVTSADSLVTATVDSRGQLVKLEFDPGAFRESNPEALARSVTMTVRRAVTQAAEAMNELMKSYLPATSGVPGFVRTGEFSELLARYDEQAGYDPRDRK